MSDHEHPVTGVCVFELHLPAAQSLKEKRQPIKSIKDSIRSRFNVSVCEFGDADLWQRCSLAVAMVANHEEPIREVFEDVRRLIESRGEVVVIDRMVDFY